MWKGVDAFAIGFGAGAFVPFVRNTQSAAFGGAVSRAGGFIAGPFSTGVE
jgi:hypothetical protein